MNDRSHRPIGIFDSGIGGLTVYQAIRRDLPNESLIYLGDTARVPYGTKSEETVRRYTQECLQFLLNKDIKLIVIACNTASAYALERLNGECPVPLLGVILPGAKAAVAQTKAKKIGVIGTEGTIRSGAYLKAIRSLDRSVEVVSAACPLFVPLVEEGWIEGDIPRQVADRYLAPLKNSRVDAVILGCTHYPLLKSVIGGLLPGIHLIDSADQTAQEAVHLLKENNLASPRKENSDQFFVTDSPSRFQRVGDIFLGHPLTDVTKIQL